MIERGGIAARATVRWFLPIVLAALAGMLVVETTDRAVPSATLPLVLLLLNALVLVPALGEADPYGILTAVAIWASHLIGWTIAQPGLLLAIIQLVLLGILVWGVLISRVHLRVRLLRWFPIWVGVLPAASGVLAALVGDQLLVAAGRSVSLAVVAAWVLVATRRDPLRLTWGFVAGIHLVLLVPLWCGAVAPLPDARFGGGACAYTHPNILGLAAWTTAIAWLIMPGRPRAARLLGASFGALLVVMADARTAAGAALVASAVLVALSLSGPSWRKGTMRAGRVVLVAVLLGAGAFALTSGFFLRERAVGVGALSGRDRIWNQALADFRAAPWWERALGTAEGGVGARVTLPGQAAPSGEGFTTDNAVVGLLRRAGVVGSLLGLCGLGLAAGELMRGLRDGDRSAALLAGAIVTIPVEDWFFSGTLFMWVVLAAGLMKSARGRRTLGEAGA